ncbi:MAG TPA: hypothetical protein V6C78_02530 [Crinalium sp.]|jgi:hypothetical protein
MKQGLKRIEATLNQLHAQPVTPTSAPKTNSQIVLSRLESLTEPSTPQDSSNLSFTVSGKNLSTSILQKKLSGSETVQPFPVQESCPDIPALPKYKSPTFSSHRHAANPALAMNLLKEMETVVGAWQIELQQILMQIQELYLEGPIVDGWLESDTREPRPRTSAERDALATATLRHADVDRLMDYVQEICNAQQPATPGKPASRTGYRLCGLDADGQLWFRPCPPEQVPHVSLAIARYQKLRQLLVRKQDLESRLTQFSQDLIALHTKLQ